jgi:hypothetical protein
MPSLYQLLPRQRHRPLELADSNDAANPLDAETWLRQGWGLANAACDDMLAVLCPGQDSVAGRREAALDHLSKCLQSARALQTALDAPPQGRPPHLKLHLFASDSLATAAAVRSTGRGDMPKVSRQGPGDGVVLRSSALLDERAGAPWKARLRSPIAWDSVTFVPGTHLGITHHPVTVDNVLYLLLDQPLS